MRKLELPPDIKVLEAAGALGDNRVRIIESNAKTVAEVTSSDGSRTYRTAIIIKNGNVIVAYSDDNGTRFRGYIGYPIIALLMIKNLLPRDTRLENALRGVKWKQLNQKFKRYQLTKEYVLKRASTVMPVEEIQEYVRRVMSRLRSYNVIYDPRIAAKI
ncbi:MAG: hypothetical protein GSR85_08245 [Desulfurococcales archaeon]|nr:hypothetical protein [Desulfurococcales archaeon]